MLRHFFFCFFFCLLLNSVGSSRSTRADFHWLPFLLSMTILLVVKSVDARQGIWKNQIQTGEKLGLRNPDEVFGFAVPLFNRTVDKICWILPVRAEGILSCIPWLNSPQYCQFLQAVRQMSDHFLPLVKHHKAPFHKAVSLCVIPYKISRAVGRNSCLDDAPLFRTFSAPRKPCCLSNCCFVFIPLF